MIKRYEKIFESSIFSVNLVKDIAYPAFSIKKAYKDISEGRFSFSSGPIVVSYYNDINKYIIEDGYHRVLQAILEGKRSMKATLKYELNHAWYDFAKINWKNPEKSFKEILLDSSIEI